MTAILSSRHLLVIGLTLAIGLDTAGQLLWKLGASRLPQTDSPAALFEAALHTPVFAAVLVVFLAQLVNWLLVLERADLSYAQPFTSLSYVSVCLLSALLFHEPIGAGRLAGVLLVFVGVLLVGLSPAPAKPAR